MVLTEVLNIHAASMQSRLNNLSTSTYDVHEVHVMYTKVHMMYIEVHVMYKSTYDVRKYI